MPKGLLHSIRLFPLDEVVTFHSFIILVDSCYFGILQLL